MKEENIKHRRMDLLTDKLLDLCIKFRTKDIIIYDYLQENVITITIKYLPRCLIVKVDYTSINPETVHNGNYFPNILYLSNERATNLCI